MTLMLSSVRRLKENQPIGYTVACQLFKIIFHEMKFHEYSRKYLTKEEFKTLCRYYSAWIKRSKYSGHYFAQRIKNAMEFIIDSDSTQPTVLDCGCGFGSESIAFGLLGAKVLGVDLSTERINVASKRLK